MLTQHCLVEEGHIPKTHASERLGCRKPGPRSLMKLLPTVLPSPPLIGHNLSELFTSGNRKAKTAGDESRNGLSDRLQQSLIPRPRQWPVTPPEDVLPGSVSQEFERTSGRITNLGRHAKIEVMKGFIINTESGLHPVLNAVRTIPTKIDR